MREVIIKAPATLVWIALAFEGGLGLLAWVLGSWLETPPAATLAFEGTALLFGILATIPMLLFGVLLLRYPVGPLRDIAHITDQVIRPFIEGCSLLDIAVISIVAGLGEEFLFRGFLQGWLTVRFGPVLALGLASLVFGLLHAITPIYAVLATLAGLYLGGLWILTGNLLTAIVVHALYDFGILTLLMHRWRNLPPAESLPQADDPFPS